MGALLQERYGSTQPGTKDAKIPPLTYVLQANMNSTSYLSHSTDYNQPQLVKGLTIAC